MISLVNSLFIFTVVEKKVCIYLKFFFYVYFLYFDCVHNNSWHFWFYKNSILTCFDLQKTTTRVSSNPAVLTTHTLCKLSSTHTHITQTHQTHLSTLAWMIKTVEAAHRSPHQYKLQGSCWLAGTFPLPLGLPWLHVQPLISLSTFSKRTDTSVLLFTTHQQPLWPTQRYSEVPQRQSRCINEHSVSETNIQVEFNLRQAHRIIVDF